MRKLLLLVIISLALINVVNASFPIFENIETEIVESGPGPNFGDLLGVAGIFSIIFSVIYFLIRLITGKVRPLSQWKRWQKVFLKVLMWLAIIVLCLSLLCSIGDGCIYNMQ